MYMYMYLKILLYNIYYNVHHLHVLYVFSRIITWIPLWLFLSLNERVAYTYMYIKLSFRKFVKGKVELEFERFCGGDVQGYHSVHLCKQIPRENKILGKSWWMPHPLNETLYMYMYLNVLYNPTPLPSLEHRENVALCTCTCMI